jgi:hypothetical protein
MNRRQYVPSARGEPGVSFIPRQLYLKEAVSMLPTAVRVRSQSRARGNRGLARAKRESSVMK